MKTKIYNLIILDESGSMECVKKQTIDGCNETINTIKTAQQKYGDTQEHLVSIYAFQSAGNVPSRYLIKNVEAGKADSITEADYSPYGMTPLFDAIGSTLVDLKATVAWQQKTIGSVTIITDGAENASKRYSGPRVARMIMELKQQGWNFNFIGANIDVEAIADNLNIDNRLSFDETDEGTDEMFRRERNGRMGYYDRVHSAYDENETAEEFAENMRMAERGYFDEETVLAGRAARRRYTPENITRLKPNEVFVFGSNLQGLHRSGAARIACVHFGAVFGQGVGLQGQSYAIPTMLGGVETIRPYVDEFIDFADEHPELVFYVTRIGCGAAGFKDRDMAPLFARAMNKSNIVLPKPFVDVIEGKGRNSIFDI